MKEKRVKRNTTKTDIVLKEPKKEYICIVCPNCCTLETDGKNVIGAGCEKGEAFALQEWIEPLRVLTTTVRCETEEGTKILPVKTGTPVPISRMHAIVKGIRKLHISEVPTIGSKITVTTPPEPLEIIVTGE
jgi:CxxC motif-containing protein